MLELSFFEQCFGRFRPTIQKTRYSSPISTSNSNSLVFLCHESIFSQFERNCLTVLMAVFRKRVVLGNDPNRQQRQPGGPGRGDNRNNAAGRGRGDPRPQNVLGTVDNDMDRRLTRREDPNRLVKKFKNKNYCHTHGYECSKDHDSSHCMWPEKGHKQCATAENPMGGCLLYKRLWQSYCVEVP